MNDDKKFLHIKALMKKMEWNEQDVDEFIYELNGWSVYRNKDKNKKLHNLFFEYVFSTSGIAFYRKNLDIV